LGLCHRQRLDAFGIGVGVGVVAAVVGRRRWGRLLWLRLDTLTIFEFLNLYRSTCSLHVKDVLVVLRQQGL
jgi:disulfide bond formation protein DsbB